MDVDLYSMVVLGTALTFLGVLLLMLSLILPALRREEGVRGEAGGVIMIGPIPIVFGSSARAATMAMMLALVLMAFGLILTLMLPSVIRYWP